MCDNRAMHILAVASGKGGVGKSTVAVNLARALHLLGSRVGLLDADIYGPSQGIMLPQKGAPREKEGEIIPDCPEGFPVVSVASFTRDAMVVRAPVANGIIEQLFKNVAWGDLDTLVVDFPPGTGDVPLTMLQVVPFTGSLLVTTPQRIALSDVEKGAQMFHSMDVPILGLIENMSYLIDNPEIKPFGEGGGIDLSSKLSLTLLAQLPLDPELGSACDEGRSLFETDSPLRDHFYALARKISSPKERPLPNLSVDDNGCHIVFTDGCTSTITPSDLQRHCPCIRCREATPPVDESVALKTFERVGVFGVKFQFSSGCSSGVYPYKLMARWR